MTRTSRSLPACFRSPEKHQKIPPVLEASLWYKVNHSNLSKPNLNQFVRPHAVSLLLLFSTILLLILYIFSADKYMYNTYVDVLVREGCTASELQRNLLHEVLNRAMALTANG